MKFEVRIPISPTPHFFRQIEYLWRSYASCGGHTANVRIRVFVGEDCEPYDLYEVNPWSRGHIEWNWSDREGFRRRGYGVTDRFHATTDADIVLLQDADTLVIRSLDDLLESLVTAPMVAGVMTHVPPFWGLAGHSWKNVYASVGRAMPPDRYEHSGWKGMFHDPAHRFAPAYFNFGVVFVPGALMPALANEYERQLETAQRTPIHRVFSGQLAFSLALYELNIPRTALPIRYNYPNDEWADRLHVNDLADVRIIHYLREEVIGSRRGTWGDEAAFKAFLHRKDLTGSNEVLRSTTSRLSVTPITVSQ